MTGTQEESRPAGWMTLLLLFLLGLAVRLPGIAGDLWLDEIGSVVGFMRLPLAGIFTTYESANNHVLYSILAHLAIVAFGEVSWAVRLPALLFGAATVPALYLLAGRVLPRREALAAALILAFSYHHAYFSQNARGYTGMVFLAVLSTLLLLRALDARGSRAWAAWAVTTAASIYLLLSGLFVCAGQVIGAALVRGPPAGRRERRRLALRLATWLSVAGLLTLLLYLPLLRSMLHFFSTADRDVGWTISWELVRIVVRDAAPSPVIAAAAVLALPVALLGLVGLARREPLLLFALALPPVIELGVAVAMGVGTYPRRFLILILIALLVAVRGSAMIADAAARWARRPALSTWLFAAAVVAGVVAAGAGLPRLYTLPKQDYHGALAVVEERRGPDDLVAAAHLAYYGTRYYDPSVLSARGPEDLQALLDRGRRVWLIGTFVADMRLRAPGLHALIVERFDEVARLPGLVGDGAMVVWRSREPARPQR